MNQFFKTKKEITHWLDEYDITDYILVLDKKYGFIVDVDYHVDLSGKNLDFIPVKFNIINGDFHCGDNRLTSLEFCPIEVKGYFNCYDNHLTSLKGSPQIVHKDFICSENQLSSLEYSPEYIKGNFDCQKNKLTSLEFCPQVINGGLKCANNDLVSLDFFPQEVTGQVWCYYNPKLGIFQNEFEFEVLKIEHLRIQHIVDFKNNLSNELSENKNKILKIKI